MCLTKTREMLSFDKLAMMTFIPCKNSQTCVPKSVQSNSRTSIWIWSALYQVKHTNNINNILFVSLLSEGWCSRMWNWWNRLHFKHNRVKGLLIISTADLHGLSQKVCNPEPFLKHQITHYCRHFAIQ